jgi:hypothetical protein
VIPLVVRGSSMRPYLRPGALAAMEKVAPGALRVGNVIVFEDDGGRPVVHRVVSTDGEIVTQGDDLPWPDGPVPAERIVGKLVARWRGRRLRRISRGEERLWLCLAAPCRRLRRLARLGARVVAPIVGSLLPLRAVRFAAGDGGQTVRLYALKKLVAWRRNEADRDVMWIHPIFANTRVERRLRSLGQTRMRP